MQIPVATLFPLLYLFTTVGSAFVMKSSFSSDYGESSDSEFSEQPVVASGDGVNPLADLDAEDETFTTEIIELSTTQTTTLKPTTTESRVRIPQTCCELGALAARQGHSCRPESHREKLRSQPSRSERLGNHLYRTKTANQAARENHKRVEAQLRNFSKCVAGISRKMEEDFTVCCKRTSKELFDEYNDESKKSPSRDASYHHYLFGRRYR